MTFKQCVKMARVNLDEGFDTTATAYAVQALEALAAERAERLARKEAEPLLPPSEMEFRQRVRDLEAAAHANALAARRMLKLADAMAAENASLRRAVRVLAKLQPEARVRRAVMEVLNDG